MALRGINAALNDPIQASTETTLAAILCLSLYEIIAFEQPKSIENWLTYTHGAAALLEIRGGEQVQREGGFDIFSALRNTVLLGCLQKKERFPKVLIDLHDQMTSKLQIDLLGVYSDHLVKISARFCNLQADIKDGGFQDDMKIFSIAMEIDSELEEFSHGLFAGFPFNLGT